MRLIPNLGQFRYFRRWKEPKLVNDDDLGRKQIGNKIFCLTLGGERSTLFSIFPNAAAYSHLVAASFNSTASAHCRATRSTNLYKYKYKYKHEYVIW